MQNIIICYTPHKASHRITSSTMAKFEKERPENLSFHILNLRKINLIKFINKNEFDKLIVYIHENEAKNIPNTLDKLKALNIKVMFYSNSSWHIPQRVPGNVLKTNVYYLYDKILAEYAHNFELTKAFKVDFWTKEISRIEISPYDAFEPMARNRNQNYNVYKTKEEALMKAQKSFQNKIDFIDEKINVLNKTIDDLENEKLELLKKKDLLNKEEIL